MRPLRPTNILKIRSATILGAVQLAAAQIAADLWDGQIAMAVRVNDRANVTKQREMNGTTTLVLPRASTAAFPGVLPFRRLAVRRALAALRLGDRPRSMRPSL